MARVALTWYENMVRKRGRKALFEVVGKTQPKSTPNNNLGDAKPTQDSCDSSLSQNMAKWPKRPKLLQVNAGKVEVSIPYQLAIALVLAIILLALVVFRLGQKYPVITDSAQQTLDNANASVEPTAAKNQQILKLEQPPIRKKGTVNPKGDHLIVITQYHTTKDLVPVRRHFAANGIETLIEKRGERFFLLTADTYKNPQKNGTDGFAARKKIITVGAAYKAPKNYETFAPKLFRDAYGEKIR